MKPHRARSALGCRLGAPWLAFAFQFWQLALDGKSSHEIAPDCATPFRLARRIRFQGAPQEAKNTSRYARVTFARGHDHAFCVVPMMTNEPRKHAETRQAENVITKRENASVAQAARHGKQSAPRSSCRTQCKNQTRFDCWVCHAHRTSGAWCSGITPA